MNQHIYALFLCTTEMARLKRTKLELNLIISISSMHALNFISFVILLCEVGF